MNLCLRRCKRKVLQNFLLKGLQQTFPFNKVSKIKWHFHGRIGLLLYKIRISKKNLMLKRFASGVFAIICLWYFNYSHYSYGSVFLQSYQLWNCSLINYESYFLPRSFWLYCVSKSNKLLFSFEYSNCHVISEQINKFTYVKTFFPVITWRRFNIYKASMRCLRRRIDVS